MFNFHLLLFGAVGVFLVLTVVIVDRITVALSSLKNNEDKFVLAHEADTDLQKIESCNVWSSFRRIVVWFEYVVTRYMVPLRPTMPAVFFSSQATQCLTEGAGRAVRKPVSGHVLQPFLLTQLMLSPIDLHGFYVYVECRSGDEIDLQTVTENNWVACDIPFPGLDVWLTVPELRKYAFLHGLHYFRSGSTRKELLQGLKDHLLDCRCFKVIVLFRQLEPPRIQKNGLTPKCTASPPSFPPLPPTRQLSMQIIRDFCDEFRHERVASTFGFLSILKW